MGALGRKVNDGAKQEDRLEGMRVPVQRPRAAARGRQGSEARPSQEQNRGGPTGLGPEPQHPAGHLKGLGLAF